MTSIATTLSHPYREEVLPQPADASTEAVEHYGRLVLKVAYTIVANADEAQEVFQETFLRFHTACARGERIAHINSGCYSAKRRPAQWKPMRTKRPSAAC